MGRIINKDAVSEALADLGWTQSNLATAVGVSAQAVTNWLKGTDFPRPKTLLKLATTLRLSSDRLVLAPNEGQPVVAFRKKGGAKTTAAHLAKAAGIGMLLKPLVPHLGEMNALRTLITSPSTEYPRLQSAVAQTRSELGIGEQATLEYDHLIGEFANCGAVLIPVLWGEKQRHENALHIRLPHEDVTFIFLNLDTHVEDFKFWMAHELAHVYTPALAGTEEGEDFSDAFAGALLFPKPSAAAAYCAATRQATVESELSVLLRYSHEHTISLNTVYQQVQRYARSAGMPPLRVQDRTIHAVRNSAPGQLVSKALFDPVPPEPHRYIAACERIFRTNFFEALKRMIRESGTGAGYIQQVLDTSTQDAIALYKEMRH